ncbi:MAG: TIM-barrel domain-containing protein [Psychromonas sp.]
MLEVATVRDACSVDCASGVVYSVDWYIDDGLASVIPGVLSSGLIGNSIDHIDIGRYTRLHGMERSKELFQSWTEMAVFTTIMRTHEGNKPADNHQYDSGSETLQHFARMAREINILSRTLKMSPYAYKQIPLS